VTVSPDGLKGQALGRWVALAVARVWTRPPKRKAVR
jgi:hypothetical protein